MKSRLILAALCLAFSLPTQATTTFGVTGASNLVTSGSLTKVYYSNISSTVVAGSYTVASTAGTDNPCDTTINASCKRPGDTLTITASSNSTANLANANMLLYVTSTLLTSPTPLAGGTLNTQTYHTKDTTVTFSGSTFAAICALVSNTNCIADTTITSPIYIYTILDVDGNGTYDSGTDEASYFTLYLQSSILQYTTAASGSEYAFYSFEAFPGDEAIHIINATVASDFPSTTNNVGAQKVRFFYQETATPATTITTQSTTTTYKDVNVDADGNFSNYYVTGLTNNATYCITSAVIDVAGNVGLISDTTTRSTSMCATPDQIIGLLSQNGQCFIATAAYGSAMESQVQTLRTFRDRFLMPHTWGRNFVSWYYKHSPSWAQVIAQSESKKSIVRFFLWPVVGYGKLALQWGGKNATLFAVTLLLLPLLLAQIFYTRRKRKLSNE